MVGEKIVADQPSFEFIFDTGNLNESYSREGRKINFNINSPMLTSLRESLNQRPRNDQKIYRSLTGLIEIFKHEYVHPLEGNNSEGEEGGHGGHDENFFKKQQILLSYFSRFPPEVIEKIVFSPKKTHELIK
jgi:hypothetical protein